MIFMITQSSILKLRNCRVVVNTVRRSTRQTKLPTSLNDFVIEGKVKYGVKKVVSYANLNHENFCFTSGLNKSVEPTCYEEAILDNNWIDGMNAEIEALNKNNTWDITDLPANRKAIVHCLAQYMHSPLKSHLNYALNVLRYLKNALGKGIRILCVFNDCLISWRSKKQNTLSKSSTEAEYGSLSSATCEIIWIQKLLFDLKTKVTVPVDLFCDNKSALQLAVNHVFHER
uniref:Ribonuclease H-like domain-containing protein n=1 Tax=Tanacetum cinerariifolium TaxID=118510 RepID=A0A6L2P6L4_TANCI|nr:ribonuclease H-like domain-containing protein [Tanacetum cinerariifolium]